MENEMPKTGSGASEGSSEETGPALSTTESQSEHTQDKTNGPPRKAKIGNEMRGTHYPDAAARSLLKIAIGIFIAIFGTVLVLFLYITSIATSLMEETGGMAGLITFILIDIFLASSIIGAIILISRGRS